jgi:hypothetical protein
MVQSARPDPACFDIDESDTIYVGIVAPNCGRREDSK